MTNRFHHAQQACFAASLLLAAVSPQALAQSGNSAGSPPTVSRPVVQSTAASPSRELNLALGRLASDPRNVAALSDAAEAALKLGDSDAAIGFLARANEVQPGNARIKVLTGKALLASENPVDAIRAFDEAEKAGGDTFEIAAERALAYDLVGDNGRAQRWYQVALSRGPNDEITRRYAMSLAISGDRRGAEALLAPLIDKQDRAAWRTRTFAMAVTNGADEAVAIAYASMPQDLAAGIAPYLRFMPRLTPAQQAAAANFGRFPRAADMGRDDPRVTQYAALNPRGPRLAEAGLIPAGAPLGSASTTGKASEKVSREKRRRPGRSDEKVAVAQVAPVRAGATVALLSTPAAAPATAPATGVPAQSASAPQQKPTVLSALDVPPGAARPPVPPIRPVTTATPSPAAQVAVRASATPPAPAPAPASGATAFDLARVGGSASSSTGASASIPPAPAPAPLASAASASATSAPASVPAQAPSPSVAVASAAPFSQSGLPATQPLAGGQSSAASAVATASVAAPAANSGAASSPPTAAAPSRPTDFASLFRSFEPPAEERSAAVAAVDITRLPPRATPKADPRGERPDGPTDVSRTPSGEPGKVGAKDIKDAKAAKDKNAKDGKSAKDAKDAKAKKAPSHPSRIWVQVLTGANKGVMDTEWRRIVKDAPEVLRGRKPYLSPWRSNFRLLTGPFESEAAAQEFVGKLRKSGVSSYQWTSPAGQAVDTLPLK